MRWLLISIGVAGVVYGYHRAATYAAGQGWIYYRNGPKRGNVAGAWGTVAAVFEPEMVYVVEELESEQTRREVSESGEDADAEAQTSGEW